MSYYTEEDNQVHPVEEDKPQTLGDIFQEYMQNDISKETQTDKGEEQAEQQEDFEGCRDKFYERIEEHIAALYESNNVNLDDADTRFSTAINMNRVKSTSVAIVGAGGIGSWVTRALVGLGFNNITLIDDDIIEHHNVGPQGHSITDIGLHKVDAMYTELLKMRGTPIIRRKVRIRDFAHLVNVVGEVPDIFITAVDNMDFRNKINEYLITHLLGSYQNSIELNSEVPKLYIDLRMSMGEWNAFTFPLKSIRQVYKKLRRDKGFLQPLIESDSFTDFNKYVRRREKLLKNDYTELENKYLIEYKKSLSSSDFYLASINLCNYFEKNVEESRKNFTLNHIFPATEGVQEACTERAIIYTGMNIGSYTAAMCHWMVDNNFCKNPNFVARFMDNEDFSLPFHYETSFDSRKWNFDLSNSEERKLRLKQAVQRNTLIRVGSHYKSLNTFVKMGEATEKFKVLTKEFDYLHNIALYEKKETLITLKENELLMQEGTSIASFISVYDQIAMLITNERGEHVEGGRDIYVPLSIRIFYNLAGQDNLDIANMAWLRSTLDAEPLLVHKIHLPSNFIKVYKRWLQEDERPFLSSTSKDLIDFLGSSRYRALSEENKIGESLLSLPEFFNLISTQLKEQNISTKYRTPIETMSLSTQVSKIQSYFNTLIDSVEILQNTMDSVSMTDINYMKDELVAWLVNGVPGEPAIDNNNNIVVLPREKITDFYSTSGLLLVKNFNTQITLDSRRREALMLITPEDSGEPIEETEPEKEQESERQMQEETESDSTSLTSESEGSLRKALIYSTSMHEARIPYDIIRYKVRGQTGEVPTYVQRVFAKPKGVLDVHSISEGFDISKFIPNTGIQYIDSCEGIVTGKADLYMITPITGAMSNTITEQLLTVWKFLQNNLVSTSTASPSEGEVASLLSVQVVEEVIPYFGTAVLEDNPGIETPYFLTVPVVLYEYDTENVYAYHTLVYVPLLEPIIGRRHEAILKEHKWVNLTNEPQYGAELSNISPNTALLNEGTWRGIVNNYTTLIEIYKEEYINA
jgi:hypothetical protein